MAIVKKFKELPDFLTKALKSHEIRLDFTYSGMYFTQEGVQRFGVRGPGQTDESLGLGEAIHDMCHFVEIEERYMHVENFGLAMYIGDFKRPKTRGFIERELRVIAMECNILAACRVGPSDIQKHLEGQLEITNIVWRRAGYVDSPETTSRIAWMEERVESMRGDADKSAKYFLAEWLRRIAIVDALESEASSLLIAA